MLVGEVCISIFQSGKSSLMSWLDDKSHKQTNSMHSVVLLCGVTSMYDLESLIPVGLNRVDGESSQIPVPV